MIYVKNSKLLFANSMLQYEYNHLLKIATEGKAVCIFYYIWVQANSLLTDKRARTHALEHIHTPVGRSNNIYYELKLQTNVGLTNEEEQSEKRASR